EAVKISLDLPITIVLPSGASEKLRAHEEGHRKIHEHFYELAERAAQRAGELMMGKQLASSATDFEAAKNEIIEQAGKAVDAEYGKYTREPSEQAGLYYDELTAHGSNKIDSDEAAEQAMGRYEVIFPE